MEVKEIPNRVFYKDGEEFLYFGGTNYLGVTTLPEFQNILLASLQKWGTSYGSSRSANIQLEIYKTAEDLIAKQIGTEAAVTISSGMLAGKLALEQLQHTTDLVFHFPNTHPALLHPFSLPLIQNGKLNPFLLDPTVSRIGIVADAIPSLEVTPIDLSILQNIPKDKEITLLLDESHSIGILGDQGQGVLNQYELPNVHRKIIIASLGKAMGLSGGIIAGDSQFIDAIKKQQNFVGASGMNPAFLETFVNAQTLYHLQRQQLKDNLNYVAKHLIHNAAFTFTQNYPAIYFDHEELLQLLLDNNIIPTSFPYPTASGKLSRIVISAHHTKADLDKMVQQLNTFTQMNSGFEGDIRFVL
ncbi:aminotransferase class I/II-fold pyridoxal phosphate-dependent enzyme [Flavobacterium sp. M31R6]|uniref:aminotransferase class I/II-fold pyridoxal phosphate-dependent enzyme n=1 Tax=Flavobacterium sp. M31R6 TaxID=2739062 RepID=UPI001568B4E0|nr:aminotransferase class I/II-fold pyridoxal phosphate-dependent enzyme [Flavobacterium sp. M31R6]QKJ63466.1 pyridoxal phosphate-dependent aminotransferase family protein [Flavobacterium sp. M31R6]